jgi:hypothetical protein
VVLDVVATMRQAQINPDHETDQRVRQNAIYFILLQTLDGNL